MADWLRQWLDGVKGDLSNGTVENYLGKIERQIIPVLGKFELRRLKPADVRRWFVEIPTKGSLSARSRIFTFKLLSAALDAAVRDEVLYRNVCDAVKMPKVKPAKVETLKEDHSTSPRLRAIGCTLSLPSRSLAALAVASFLPCAGAMSTSTRVTCGSSVPCSTPRPGD